jgi:phosphatidylglycerophosphatase A
MWLVLVGLPKSPLVLLIGFLLFRILDIGKFPPMKQLERLPGGWGIMLDDVAAGVIARLLLVVGLVLMGHTR